MMKYAAWVTLLAGVAIAGVWALAEAPAKGKPAAKNHKPPADNHACFVCHANYDGEPMSERHAKAGIGCVECHGQSTAHRNDEDNITPPDRMYPADAIDKACHHCHQTHDVPARAVLAHLQRRSLTAKDPKELNCTDCHGKHRLEHRSVQWDKKTGKLLPRAAAKGKG
jgi:hypothetical protein